MRKGRASVIVVNKWDAVPQKDTHTLATYQKEILVQLRPLHWATVVFTSALNGMPSQVARFAGRLQGSFLL